MAPPRMPCIEGEPEAMAIANAMGAAEPPTARARQNIAKRASDRAHTPQAVRLTLTTGSL